MNEGLKYLRSCYNVDGKAKKKYKTEDLAWASGHGRPYRCPLKGEHDHGWHISSVKEEEGPSNA